MSQPGETLPIIEGIDQHRDDLTNFFDTSLERSERMELTEMQKRPKLNQVLPIEFSKQVRFLILAVLCEYQDDTLRTMGQWINRSAYRLKIEDISTTLSEVSTTIFNELAGAEIDLNSFEDAVLAKCTKIIEGTQLSKTEKAGISIIPKKKRVPPPPVSVVA